MNFRNKYKWLKHIDFIVLDLICLTVSFIVAYYLKFDVFNAFEKEEWSSLFVIICFINLIVMFAVNPYRGILKRRYYLQFKKECTLFGYQLALVCIVFYALKIGTIFSREMMFSMYFIYFIFSQCIKYIYKKIINNEINIYIHKKEYQSNSELQELLIIKKKSFLIILVYEMIKRMIDILAGIIGCAFLVPLTLCVFVLNRLNEDDGPVFYIQERIGKHGKIFKMFKYRSMCVGADEKLKQFLEENEDIREEFYIYRKIKNDPRITKLGKFLRKTSIDEFPQFINLLIGNMSLVGPRPYLEREKNDMGDYYEIIIKDKPGITGLWQISGRSDVTFKERLRMDLEYYSTKSIRKDITIIFKTVCNVLNKKGAR